MLRFLSELWEALTASAPPKQNTTEDREFTFHEEPWQIPEELNGLQVERLLDSGRGTLLLRGFDVDLTADQTASSDDPKTIAWSSRALRWAAKYHGLNAEGIAPVRLHRENLLLLRSRLFQSSPDQLEAIILRWLSSFDWSSDRPLSYQQAFTTRPVEDGYFRCIRAVTDEAAARTAEDDRLVWQEFEVAGPLTEVLVSFMQEESDERELVEDHIRSFYEGIPREQLTHPAFALMEYPTFDGMAVLEFAGSVWSPHELWFWSRAGYLHK